MGGVHWDSSAKLSAAQIPRHVIIHRSLVNNARCVHMANKLYMRASHTLEYRNEMRVLGLFYPPK